MLKRIAIKAEENQRVAPEGFGSFIPIDRVPGGDEQRLKTITEFPAPSSTDDQRTTHVARARSSEGSPRALEVRDDGFSLSPDGVTEYARSLELDDALWRYDHSRAHPDTPIPWDLFPGDSLEERSSFFSRKF